jgi:hypothetical protein
MLIFMCSRKLRVFNTKAFDSTERTSYVKSILLKIVSKASSYCGNNP